MDWLASIYVAVIYLPIVALLPIFRCTRSFFSPLSILEGDAYSRAASDRGNTVHALVHPLHEAAMLKYICTTEQYKLQHLKKIL